CSHANALLRTEAEMFEKWYCKMEPRGPLPQLPSEMQDTPPELTQVLLRSQGTVCMAAGAGYKSKLRGASDYFVELTVEEKCKLAEWELTEMKDEIQRMKQDLEQTLQNLEAVIEAVDIWWAEVKKARSDFEKDIISIISSKNGSIVASEKLLRHMEKKNRQRELLRDKLRLENCLLRDYKKKLHEQLRQKEQKGEMLCADRLQQLQVRNAQYKEKIDEKNQELLQLKLTSRKTAQVLNFHKRKLQDAMEMSTSLVKDISQKKKLLEKIERELVLVEEQQRAEAEHVNWRLRKQLSDYSVPPVMSYVQKKMALTDLEKSLKAWERKVVVAEMSLQSYRRVRNQVKMSGNQH
ncbi:CC113 protein, partial [Steatornis caripensis]|nr:CC113 protein [Steatornis caripensis]